MTSLLEVNCSSNPLFCRAKSDQSRRHLAGVFIYAQAWAGLTVQSAARARHQRVQPRSWTCHDSSDVQRACRCGSPSSLHSTASLAMPSALRRAPSSWHRCKLQRAVSWSRSSCAQTSGSSASAEPHAARFWLACLRRLRVRAQRCRLFLAYSRAEHGGRKHRKQ